MARKRSESEETPARKGSKEARDLVQRVRDRYKLMEEADHDNREKARSDYKFVNVPGNQWPDAAKKKRGKRPCSEYNKLRIKCKRIINEMRSNRPSGKVRGVEDNDKDTAEIYDGLIRNIWTVSDGDTIADGAADYQVAAGMAAWRLDNDYISDSAFDQHLMVSAIANPIDSLYWDPSDLSPTKANARDWILIERISKAEYEERFPNREIVDFETDDGCSQMWQDEDTVQIAEYHYREPYEKKLYLTQDGRTLDEENAKLVPRETIVRERVAKCWKVYSCIVSGDAVLEKPKLLAGQHHRFVVIFGDHTVVDGKVVWSGLVRFSRDQQIAYNMARTAIDESVMNAPNQSKWWATPEQAKGHEGKWNQAFEENIPWLAYNPDRNTGNAPPQAMNFNPVNQALIGVAEMNDRDMASTSGIEDDNLGIDTSAKSGRAIIAKQNQGALATFNYQDNMAKGHRRTYEILIDLIPHYYDTQRQLRILGTDGAEKYVKINEIVIGQDGQPQTINDLSRGKYDVAVTVGPSFTSRRQEAAEVYTQLSQANPAVMGVAGDLIMKSMDLPYSDDIADRMRAMLPPQIQRQLQQGKDVPPEVAQGMAQVQQAAQMVEQQTMLLNQAQAEVDQAKTEAEKATAQLKVERAQLAADVAKAEANLALKQANLVLKSAQDTASLSSDENTKNGEKIDNTLAQFMTQIQEQQAQFMAQMSSAFAELTARQQPVVVVPPKPRIVRIEQQRVNGQLIAVPVYENAGTVQ